MRLRVLRSGSSPSGARGATRRGSAAIEFALVLPVLLVCVLGVLDYGWYFYNEMLVLSAVKEGTRYGAATPRTNDPAGVAAARVRTTLNTYGLPGGTAYVASALKGVKPDTTLQVTGTLPYVPLSGFVSVPGSLSATMTMRLEDNL